MKVILSLGSNIGDSLSILENAITDISNHLQITLLKKSSFYVTKPVGFLDQDDFLNACVSIETTLDARSLLLFCQKIEQKYKRVRLFKNGPRTLDIDIIAIEKITLNEVDLIVPHERMHERAFVLVPLNEIEKDFYVENLGFVHELLAKIPTSELKNIKRKE